MYRSMIFVGALMLATARLAQADEAIPMAELESAKYQRLQIAVDKKNKHIYGFFNGHWGEKNSKVDCRFLLFGDYVNTQDYATESYNVQIWHPKSPQKIYSAKIRNTVAPFSKALTLQVGSENNLPKGCAFTALFEQGAGATLAKLWNIGAPVLRVTSKGRAYIYQKTSTGEAGVSMIKSAIYLPRSSVIWVDNQNVPAPEGMVWGVVYDKITNQGNGGFFKEQDLYPAIPKPIDDKVIYPN